MYGGAIRHGFQEWPAIDRDEMTGMRPLAGFLAGVAVVAGLAVVGVMVVLLPHDESTGVDLAGGSGEEDRIPVFSPTPGSSGLPLGATILTLPAPDSPSLKVSASPEITLESAPPYNGLRMPRLWDLDEKTAVALMAGLGFETDVRFQDPNSVATPGGKWSVVGQFPGPDDPLRATMKVMIAVAPESVRR